ncbi:type III-B CRISPR module RAMP protein Cmr4 [Microcoleus sp.]|uniref:type III-B CRISPR module RAMP protein Cmr4 n=1 Tax=Microcoleus sp. TaxID=44472 RepID=UPI003524F273
MNSYLTYLYLLTPLHTGGSADEGNLMGIAREVHTEFPYLPSSSLRGKIRSQLEANYQAEANILFGNKIEGAQQPTEGAVWFADASLLLFPIASFSHQFLWITCPLWLSRWNRWLQNEQLEPLIQNWRMLLNNPAPNGKKAICSLTGQEIYLQGAILKSRDIEPIAKNAACWAEFDKLPNGDGILNLKDKLIVMSDADCGTFVEIGLQREVRIALEPGKKTAAEGSFRSEEAIPSEAVLFFPWAFKTVKDTAPTQKIRAALTELLGDRVQYRIQFGGLEGLGRGWTDAKTVNLSPVKSQGES